MTYTEVLERMKEEIQEYGDFDLKYALEVYNKIIITYKERLNHAKESLEKCRMERRAIIEEIEKRKKNAS